VGVAQPKYMLKKMIRMKPAFVTTLSSVSP